MKVYTQGGSVLELCEPALGSGAEGRVLAMKGFGGRVAKVYLAYEPERARKVEAMVALAPQVKQAPELACVAWPLAALYRDPACRELAGFGMRRLETAASFEQLYEYPDASPVPLDHGAKARLVAQLARTVHAIHEQGHVVGDLNDRNIVLTGAGSVGLVDADSFGVRASGRRFGCTMGTSGYLAPELVRASQGTDFAHCDPDVFCRETDRFALAVHAFKMLMNGAHPYHCAGLPDPGGSVPAPLPLERRVERGETPFFKRVPGQVPPPFAPDVAALPPYLRAAFCQAFIGGQRHPSARPTCLAWAALLERYASELVTCPANPRHRYHRDLAHCPYCAADRRAAAGVLAPAGSYPHPQRRVSGALKRPASQPSPARSPQGAPAGTAPTRRRVPLGRRTAAAAGAAALGGVAAASGAALPVVAAPVAGPAGATSLAPATAAPVAGAATGTLGAPGSAGGFSANTGWWVALILGTAALWGCLFNPAGAVSVRVAEELGELPAWYPPVAACATMLGALGYAGLSSERTVAWQLKACTCGLALGLLAAGAALATPALAQDPEAVAQGVGSLLLLALGLWLLFKHPKLLFWGVVVLVVLQSCGGGL